MDQIHCHAYASNAVKLLMTLPGIGASTAHAIIAAIGDIGRFESAGQLAAYFGLVPSVHQSAERSFHGRITKQGNRHHVHLAAFSGAQALSRLCEGQLTVERAMNTSKMQTHDSAPKQAMVLVAMEMEMGLKSWRLAMAPPQAQRHRQVVIEAGMA